MKTFTLKILIFLFIIGFVCCKSKDVIPKFDIVGTWNIDKIYLGDSLSTPIDNLNTLGNFYPCVKTYKINFKTDKTFNLVLPNNCLDSTNVYNLLFIPISGNYNITDNGILEITDLDGKSEMGNYTVNGNLLTWKVNINGSSSSNYNYQFVFKR